MEGIKEELECTQNPWQFLGNGRSAQSLDLPSCWIKVRERLYSGEVKAEDYMEGALGTPENRGSDASS